MVKLWSGSTRLLIQTPKITLSLSFSSSTPLKSTSAAASLASPSDDHIARLILDQKTPREALQTFRWASSHLPNFTHSQSTYRALIHKLCTFRHFHTVRQLLDEMPHPIHDDVFITIIRGLARARMIHHVIQIPHLISASGNTPSLKVFNSILDVLVKQDIDLASKFFRNTMMRKTGLHADQYTYAILMKGLCSTNRIADAFKLLQFIKARCLNPNTVIYNTLLHALCSLQKVGRARSLMTQMQHPNDVTFNILISGYCKEGNFAQALALFEKCFSSGFVPDVITLTKLIQLLCNKSRVTEAVEILERVESKGGQIDVVAYNTLIKGYCGLRKMKVALSLLKEMERKGCLANVDTYNALISGFCDSGMLDSALEMGNSMKTDGINWNFATYDTLIRSLFSGGRTKDGFKILELMEESKGGSKGHISPYNSVVYGLYRRNCYDEALDFLTKMEKLFPKAVNNSLRILGLCEEDKMEDANGVYVEMMGEGASPSVLVFDHLIHGFSQQGLLQEAFEVMNEMINRGYLPVASTFNSVISEFCRRDKTKRALKLLEDMVVRGCVPDSGSYSALIEAVARKGEFQNGLMLLIEMVEKGIIPNGTIWKCLLVCLSKQPIWLVCKNTFHFEEDEEFEEDDLVFTGSCFQTRFCQTPFAIAIFSKSQSWLTPDNEMLSIIHFLVQAHHLYTGLQLSVK
ncbi:hypothetical protein ACFE04_001921 [Oxalis oulophora]